MRRLLECQMQWISMNGYSGKVVVPYLLSLVRKPGGTEWVLLCIDNLEGVARNINPRLCERGWIYISVLAVIEAPLPVDPSAGCTSEGYMT